MNEGGRASRGALLTLHRALSRSDAVATADGVTPLDRRRLNLRWLCASSLIATCGAALMGAALRLSVDTDLAPAKPTFRQVSAQAAEGQGVIGRRGDRLVRHPLVASDREEFSAPVTEQAGARELIRTQPFVRLVTSLSAGDAVDGQIPPFDPTRQLAEDGQVATVSDEPGDDPSGTTVTITRSALADVPVAEDAPGLTDEDVTALVEAQAQVAREAGPRIAVPYAPQRLLSQILIDAPGDAAAKAVGAEPSRDTFHAIEVRVVPENITDLAESEPASVTSLTETRDIVLKRGETLADALAANGAEPARVAAILAAFSEHARTGLAEGQHVDLLLIRSRAGQAVRQIARVTLYGAGGVEEVVAERDTGGFVTVAPPSDQVAAARSGDETDGSGASLYRSIYEAVLRNGLPGILAERIVGIFAFGLDMQHRITPSDRLEVLFSPSEKAGGPPEVRYVALTLDGVKHRAYRFETPETGAARYFSEAGTSLRKFLMRMPIADGRITSPFGTRVHPILHYARFHNGVDWANKAGTPIMATGDGTVAYAGPRGGYGNRIEIHHANGYVTAYNHLQRLAHGVAVGTTVHQGQVIAYMGSTGLSTGPHVHYEVSVNGRFLDPMTIRLPDSQGVPAKSMAAFERQVAATNTIRHHGALAMSALPL
ncbi:M23 family metallopeptidase [Methylobacterium sp. C33D]|uniref:M23 family metallopeptidase n=1 Tax=Methylobacterium mesophilicum TaxID=39956 RepID=UPI002F305EEE